VLDLSTSTGSRASSPSGPPSPPAKKPVALPHTESFKTASQESVVGVHVVPEIRMEGATPDGEEDESFWAESADRMKRLSGVEDDV
jgi:hypothetical protein